MSKPPAQKRLTIPQIAALKGKKPIVVLTAYTAPMAELLDSQVDILLVGDSLGMVVYGMPTTLGVSVEDMLRHTRSVVEASHHALVIADMPFGSYQESPEQAYRNCARMLAETGCDAVKLEGGEELAETVRFLTARGVPVMAHVGLMPQRVKALGGYRYLGRTEEERDTIQRDAELMQEAGAFSVLMECVEQSVAAEVTKALRVPTIGIGCGQGCDGQVVVTEDMLGMFEHTARFIKRYADIRGVIADAVKGYAEDVRAGRYPGPEHGVGKKES